MKRIQITFDLHGKGINVSNLIDRDQRGNIKTNVLIKSNIFKSEPTWAVAWTSIMYNTKFIKGRKKKQSMIDTDYTPSRRWSSSGRGGSYIHWCYGHRLTIRDLECVIGYVGMNGTFYSSANMEKYRKFYNHHIVNIKPSSFISKLRNSIGIIGVQINELDK